MSNSSLISFTKMSPNMTARDSKIDTITIHHCAGNISIEQLGSIFANSARQASSNYGIGSDGRIGLYVDESNRSWCSSNRANDMRAITIEVANNGGADTNWSISNEAYISLINLLVDVCKRNGIKELKWSNDKSLIGNIKKQNMTVHRWFSATACPGEYLFSRMGQIASDVNKLLNPVVKPTPTPVQTPVTPAKKSNEEVAMEIVKGVGGWGNGLERIANLTHQGYDPNVVQGIVNVLMGKPQVTPAPVAPTPAPVAPTPVKKSNEEVAREIVKGTGGWGNGNVRKSNLAAQGYDYKTIQSIVNSLMK